MNVGFRLNTYNYINTILCKQLFVWNTNLPKTCPKWNTIFVQKYSLQVFLYYNPY